MSLPFAQREYLRAFDRFLKARTDAERVDAREHMAYLLEWVLGGTDPGDVPALQERLGAHMGRMRP